MIQAAASGQALQEQPRNPQHLESMENYAQRPPLRHQAQARFAGRALAKAKARARLFFHPQAGGHGRNGQTLALLPGQRLEEPAPKRSTSAALLAQTDQAAGIGRRDAQEPAEDHQSAA